MAQDNEMTQIQEPNEVEQEVQSKDFAWKYCTAVNENKKHISCNYCGMSMWDEINRFKYHIARIKGNTLGHFGPLTRF